MNGNELQQVLIKNNYPKINGMKFYNIFSHIKEVTLPRMPFITPDALNMDINLYQSMVMVLSVMYGYYSIKNKSVALKIMKFMTSNPMYLLRKNRYSLRFHYNGARKACYKFLKRLFGDDNN